MIGTSGRWSEIRRALLPDWVKTQIASTLGECVHDGAHGGANRLGARRDRRQALDERGHAVRAARRRTEGGHDLGAAREAQLRASLRRRLPSGHNLQGDLDLRTARIFAERERSCGLVDTLYPTGAVMNSAGVCTA